MPLLLRVCTTVPHSMVYIHCLQVRDRAMLYLTQLGGAAGGTEEISPQLDVNLAAMEAALRDYVAADDTPQPFDVVSDFQHSTRLAAVL